MESLDTYLYYMHRHGHSSIAAEQKTDFENMLKDEGIDFSRRPLYTEDDQDYYFYENQSDPISCDAFKRRWR